MCSLNPPLPQNTFAGPGGEGVDISGGHYSAGHKETGEEPAGFPGGARTVHTQLCLGGGRRRLSLYSVLTTSQWGRVCVICTISVGLGGLSEKSCPPRWKCPPKQHSASLGLFSGQPETRGCDNPTIGPSQGCSHRRWTRLPEPTCSPACLSAGLRGHSGQRAILDGLHSHAHATLSHALTVPGRAPRAHGPASLLTAWSPGSARWGSVLLGNRNCDFHLMAARLQINRWDSKEMQTKNRRAHICPNTFLQRQDFFLSNYLGLMKRKTNMKDLNN